VTRTESVQKGAATVDGLVLDLRRKSVLAVGCLVVIAAVGNATLITQARSGQRTVNAFRTKTAVVSAEVAKMQTQFYNDDDGMNMYVLLAATQPTQRQLAQSTYDGALAAAAD